MMNRLVVIVVVFATFVGAAMAFAQVTVKEVAVARLLNTVDKALPVFAECRAFAEREIETIQRQAFTIDSLMRLSR